MSNSVTPRTAARQAPLSFTTSQFAHWCHPTILVMPSNKSHPVTLYLPSLFPSITVFSNESALPIRWPENWTFSLSPSNEYSGWFLLGLTGLISLLSKGLSRVSSSTTVRNHQFFGAQLSLWSTSHIHNWSIALTRWTFVGKVMSLLFNMLSSFLICWS